MRKYLFNNRLSKTHRRFPETFRQGNPLRFSRQSEALNFLKTASGDGDVMRELRTWAGQRGAPVARSDRDLLRYAAQCLVTDRLEVRTPVKVLRSTPEAVAEQPSQTMRRDSPKLKPRQEVATEPEVDLDIEQQIAALKAAAKDGAPFCEQCARARLEAGR